MSMTKAQQVYAINSIEKILSKKRAEVRKEEAWERVSLLAADKHKLIVEGKVKLRKDIGDYTHYNHTQDLYFDFSKFEKKAGITTKGQRLIDKLDAAETEAKDMIMLGDAEDALKLLADLKKL